MRLQIITLSFLLYSAFSWSQRKSDLLMEIQQLKTNIEQQNDSIRKLRSELLSKSVLIDTYSNDLRDMRETNTNLMNTMGKFTSESVANTMKVNSKLANINDIEDSLELTDTLEVRELDSRTVAGLVLPTRPPAALLPPRHRHEQLRPRGGERGDLRVAQHAVLVLIRGVDGEAGFADAAAEHVRGGHGHGDRH